MKKAMADMAPGDVLVSETTDPDLLEAFKKASAVVTNVGGMLSHAAITSRELNIPCIVGTGVATRILKNGDLVEVDADRGVVTRLP
jgi:pyruvate,water dikinase